MFGAYVTGMRARYTGVAARTIAPEGLMLHQIISVEHNIQCCATYTPFSAATRLACLFLSSAMISSYCSVIFGCNQAVKKVKWKAASCCHPI
jgi:hypothetical protein